MMLYIYMGEANLGVKAPARHVLPSALYTIRNELQPLGLGVFPVFQPQPEIDAPLHRQRGAALQREQLLSV
jgi:hypothetical protein